jgi:hypothetical protein
MRKPYVPVTAVLLLVALLVLAGCSSWLESPTKPANDAIEQANGRLEKAASLEEDVRSRMSSLDELPATSDGAAQGLELIAGLRETIASEKAELTAARTAMDGISKMKVADEYKEYARLESHAIDTRVTMTDTTLRLFDAMDVLYNSVKDKKSDVDPEQIQVVIDQVKKELSDLGKQAEKEAQAARDFFDASELGGA